MASFLTTEAIQHLSSDFDLQMGIIDFVGIDIHGMKTAIIRNSKSLTTYKAVVKIAESMEKKPDEIIMEIPN